MARKGEMGEEGITEKKENKTKEGERKKDTVIKCRNMIFTFNYFVPQPGLQSQVFL